MRYARTDFGNHHTAVTLTNDADEMFVDLIQYGLNTVLARRKISVRSGLTTDVTLKYTTNGLAID